MTTTINADTVTGGAVVTADASGVLGLQAAGNTGITLNSSRAIGVGASPSYGTSGQVLTSAGSAAAPTWTTPSAGALTLLQTVTASSSSTVTIDTTFSSTYDMYVIIVSGGTSSAGGAIRCILNIGGTYQTTSYYGNYFINQTTAVNATEISNAANLALLNNTPSSTNAFSGILYVNNPASTTLSKSVYSQFFANLITPGAYQQNMTGWYSGSTAALTGVRFSMGGGTITTGTFRLYGYSNS